MLAERLKNGKLRVPVALFGKEGVLADGFQEIGPDDPAYEAWDRWLSENAPREEVTPEKPESNERAADLKRWEKKALARIREGRGPGCLFGSPAIPNAEHNRILEGLRRCTTPDQVKAFFRAEREAVPVLPAPALDLNAQMKQNLLAKWRKRRAEYEAASGEKLEEEGEGTP